MAPGQKASLAPPYSNLSSFGSKFTACDIVGLFGAPRSDSAPPLRFGVRGIVHPFPPRYAPARYSCYWGPL